MQLHLQIGKQCSNTVRSVTVNVSIECSLAFSSRQQVYKTLPSIAKSMTARIC